MQIAVYLSSKLVDNTKPIKKMKMESLMYVIIKRRPLKGR